MTAPGRYRPGVLVWPSLAERRAMRAAETAATPTPPFGSRADTIGKDAGPSLRPDRHLAPSACGPTTAADGASFDLQLPGTGPGGSIETVLAKRMAQIARGFTPQADAVGPDGYLEEQAKRWLYRAWLSRHQGLDNAAARRAARADYAHAAALVIAAIDRIDFIERSARAA